MEFIKAKNYEDMSRMAADIMAAEVLKKPECVLGLATGSTPLGMYRELVQRCQAGTVSFKGVTTVNLDEYRGLSRDNKQSYYYFMHHNFFEQVDIDPARTNVPDGMAENMGEECERYDRLIEGVGGIDLQLLGIGRNGHIGFNEPSDCYMKGTHVVKLEGSTAEANKRFFGPGESVPSQAYTMGIGTIMSAEKILLLASGKDKAWAVKQLIYGDVTPRVPCTILQFHRDVTVVADEEACWFL